MIETYTKDDYAKAYTELLQILQYIAKNDFNKIPKEVIDFFEENKDENYDYQYRLEIPFEKQPMLRLTQGLIANLYLQYWATDEEKKRIKKEEQEYWMLLEKEKREKYQSNAMFPKEKKRVRQEPETSLVVVKNKNINNQIIEKIKEKWRLLKPY